MIALTIMHVLARWNRKHLILDAERIINFNPFKTFGLFSTKKCNLN